MLKICQPKILGIESIVLSLEECKKNRTFTINDKSTITDNEKCFNNEFPCLNFKENNKQNIQSKDLLLCKSFFDAYTAFKQNNCDGVFVSFAPKDKTCTTMEEMQLSCNTNKNTSNIKWKASNDSIMLQPAQNPPFLNITKNITLYNSITKFIEPSVVLNQSFSLPFAYIATEYKNICTTQHDINTQITNTLNASSIQLSKTKTIPTTTVYTPTNNPNIGVEKTTTPMTPTTSINKDFVAMVISISIAVAALCLLLIVAIVSYYKYYVKRYYVKDKTEKDNNSQTLPTIIEEDIESNQLNVIEKPSTNQSSSEQSYKIVTSE